jgi:hypothetical protein
VRVCSSQVFRVELRAVDTDEDLFWMGLLAKAPIDVVDALAEPRTLLGNYKRLIADRCREPGGIFIFGRREANGAGPQRRIFTGAIEQAAGRRGRLRADLCGKPPLRAVRRFEHQHQARGGIRRVGL